MESYRLYKSEMTQLFSAFTKENFTIIGQGIDEKQKVVFKEVTSFQELALEEAIPLQPPKSYLFPPTERIFSYTKTKEGSSNIFTEVDNTASEKMILFALRPCDLHAIKYLRHFYEGNFPDPYFLTKLENTILVGIACEYPSNACFCTTMGVSPVSEEGADIYLTPHENYFVVEFLTEKGKSIQPLFAEFLKKAETTDNELKAAIEEKTSQKLLEKIDLEGLKGQVGKTYDQPFWKKYSDNCVVCGACTFDCPTCTCFDSRDVAESKEDGYRYRAWDSCAFSSFTLHASGHNPRGTKVDRLRQRIMHKYHYSVVQMQTWSCTGCGRCIRVCPVGINTRSILKDIKEALHE